ncbi:hypothetical protein D9M70_548050 [compost metagenome]
MLLTHCSEHGLPAPTGVSAGDEYPPEDIGRLFHPPRLGVLNSSHSWGYYCGHGGQSVSYRWHYPSLVHLPASSNAHLFQWFACIEGHLDCVGVHPVRSGQDFAEEFHVVNEAA